MCKCKLDRFSLISWISGNWLHSVGIFCGDKESKPGKKKISNAYQIIFYVNWRKVSQPLDKSSFFCEWKHPCISGSDERPNGKYSHGGGFPIHMESILYRTILTKGLTIPNYMQFISKMIKRNYSSFAWCSMWVPHSSRCECGFHMQMPYIWLVSDCAKHLLSCSVMRQRVHQF